MATNNRARVCAVGSERDMIRMLSVMLDNCFALPSTEDRAPFTLAELQELVLNYTHETAPEEDTFLYAMISPMCYGSAETGTCRLSIREEACGLWTACFDYFSQEPFQPHEWRDLHNRCGQMLMVAQRASWDFGAEKGEVIFTGGHVLDNWDNMNECWLWLVAQYECGFPPEEAVRRLKKLQSTLEREEADMDVDELLRSAMDNLRAIALQAEDAQALRAGMLRCAENRDFDGLLELQHLIAESVLWETEHNAKWLACMETVLNAWLADGCE